MPLPKENKVSNKKLREAFIASQEPPALIAEFAGFLKKRNGELKGGDPSRLLRMLGIMPYKIVNGEKRYHSTMTEENAQAIGRALNLFPIDYDL